MPPPKGSRTKRRYGPRAEASRAVRTGLLVVALFAVLLGGLITFFVVLDRETFELGEDLCPKDRTFAPPKVTVLLIDQTNQLKPLHQQALRTHFRQLRYQEFESEEAQTRARFARIEIYSFRGRPGSAALDITHHLSLCNPGGVTGLTKYTRNPEQVRRQFEDLFLKRLDEQLRSLLEFKESPQSPVLEALKHVSLDVFNEPRFAKSQKLLLMISDGLHNTPELRMHSHVPAFDQFSRTPYGNRMVGDFRGAPVRWLLVDTQQALQRDVVKRFWEGYFGAAKARSAEFVFVP